MARPLMVAEISAVPLRVVDVMYRPATILPAVFILVALWPSHSKNLQIAVVKPPDFVTHGYVTRIVLPPAALK
jgi:hypothetical protein